MLDAMLRQTSRNEPEVTPQLVLWIGANSRFEALVLPQARLQTTNWEADHGANPHQGARTGGSPRVSMVAEAWGLPGSFRNAEMASREQFQGTLLDYSSGYRILYRGFMTAKSPFFPETMQNLGRRLVLAKNDH